MKKLNYEIFVAIGLMAATLSSSAFAARVVGSVPTKGLLVSEYPKLAKITCGQAAKIARSIAHGDVISISLESEDGSLVYAVEVANVASGFKEVNVDAGNGSVLSVTAHTENSDEDISDDAV